MKYTLQKTETFSQWLDKLKDPVVRNKVLTRLDRTSNGNFGDYKVLTPNVSELRFTFGAGLRVYYTVKKNHVILLLAGGNKSTQQRDIEKAIALFNALES